MIILYGIVDVLVFFDAELILQILNQRIVVRYSVLSECTDQ